MHLEWRSMLEVGVAEMDDDHRRLIELLNRAQDASADDDQRASLSVLHELQDFVAWHFAREELLMARLRYGGSGAHRNEHEQLLEGMRWQIRELEQGRIVAGAVAVYMQRWLLRHIADADRELGEAVRRQRDPANGASGGGCGPGPEAKLVEP